MCRRFPRQRKRVAVQKAKRRGRRTAPLAPHASQSPALFQKLKARGRLCFPAGLKVSPRRAHTGCRTILSHRRPPQNGYAVKNTLEKRPNETTRTIYETGPRPALRRAALHRRSGLRAFLLRAGAIRPVRRKAPRAVYFPGQLHAVQRPADPRLRGDYALSLSSKEDCEEASRWAGEVLDSRHAFQRSSLTDAQRLT